MEVIKFAKVDWLKTKSQAKLILLFIVLATYMSLYMEMAMWSLFYIAFGATVVSTTPFSLEVKSTNGFINLLPAKANSRSKGRFLFGTLFITSSIILGEIPLLVCFFIKREFPQNALEISIIIIAVALILNALQFLALSFIKLKSQQVMQLIRMIPPFVMFYCGNYVMNLLNSKNEKSLEMISSVVRFCMNRKTILSIDLLIAALVITYLSAVIAGLNDNIRES